MFYRIVAPYFVAGIETDLYGNIFRTAPILRYSFKMGLTKFFSYCNRKGWQIEVLDD